MKRLCQGTMGMFMKRSRRSWVVFIVALMGQVLVKVKGTIQHGDYVELDDNGIGRRAKNWHPEVIGRADEPDGCIFTI